MFANIYKGKKILVTGHTGFKGSWLSSWLLALGAEPAGYSNGVPTTPANYNVLNLAGKMRHFKGDIRDLDQLTRVVREVQPKIIFHLAAQSLVRKSYEDPLETISVNALGTMNILQCCRGCDSVKAIVIITSDKCYRNDEWVWGYRETDHLGGSDPYSASKGCAEIIAHSYFDSFFQDGPAGATVRAGNVIGGGDWAKDRILPDCARSWASRKPVSIRNPNATRPWQHVLEPLSGYLWLGAHLLDSGVSGPAVFDVRGQSYNFGPPAEIDAPVREVAALLQNFWPGFEYVFEKDQMAPKKEATLLKLCCDKALAHLAWKATLSFEESLRYAAEWYSCFYEGDSGEMWKFTQGQIAAYCNAALERGLEWAKT